MFKHLSIFRFAVIPKPEAEIKSVQGHKPPQYEDTVWGKYAGVLFSIASQREALHIVLQDMKYFKELSENSLAFRDFTQNVSFKRSQQRSVLQTITKEGFHEVTLNFLNTMVENARIQFLAKTADKYIEYYRILNKEENITIISAKDLSTDEKSQVISALKEQNPAVQFQVQYKVDPSILGGLQMYSGNKFLDCSLVSRVNKLKSELQKLSI